MFFVQKGVFAIFNFHTTFNSRFDTKKVYKYNVSKWNKYDISGALFTFGLSIRYTVYRILKSNVKRAPDMSYLIHLGTLYGIYTLFWCQNANCRSYRS